MIAADLTLYSNPLNTALATQALEARKSDAKGKTTGKKGNKKAKRGSDAASANEDCVIAADMTKYDSPLAELDQMSALNIKGESVLKQSGKNKPEVKASSTVKSHGSSEK